LLPTARRHLKTTSQTSHASHRIGTYRSPRPVGCHRFRYPLRGRMPADQFSPSRHIESSGVFVVPGEDSPPARWFATMASADFPRHFLRGISPGKNALLPCATAAFTSTAKPEDFAVWCQLVPPCRPSMRFLSISSQVSPSLPPPGRLPFQSWLQVVVVALLYDAWFSNRGLSPRLQRAHAGRTPVESPNVVPLRSTTSVLSSLDALDM